MPSEHIKIKPQRPASNAPSCTQPSWLHSSHRILGDSMKARMKWVQEVYIPILRSRQFPVILKHPISSLIPPSTFTRHSPICPRCCTRSTTTSSSRPIAPKPWVNFLSTTMDPVAMIRSVLVSTTTTVKYVLGTERMLLNCKTHASSPGSDTVDRCDSTDRCPLL